MSMDVSEYRRRLEAKFGTSARLSPTVKNSQVSLNAPIEHTCASCAKPYKASPLVMLGQSKTDPVCIKCSRKNEHNASGNKKDAMVKKLRKKFRTRITLVHWNEALSTFACSCGQTFKARPTEVMRMKAKGAGCRACSASKMGLGSKTFAVLCKMVKTRTDLKLKHADKKKELVRVACVSCGHSWSEGPVEVLSSNGCSKCCSGARELLVSVTLAGKKMRVTSKQAQIISNLIERKCPGKKIKTGGTTLEYKSGKAVLRYTPQIVVGKTAYDLVPSEDLALHWKAKVSEAKACEKADKRLSLLVSVEGTIVTMPRKWHKMKIAEALKVLTSDPEEMTILSMDPGTSNHAWSVLHVGKGFKITVLGSGMVHNTIKDLKGDMLGKTAKYIEEVAEIAEHYGASHFIMERYMARGMKGSTIECVNVMIGALMGSAAHRLGITADRMMVIPASQWKNEWNRRSDLEAFYDKTKCVNHQVDSVGIGLYGAAIWFSRKPFENIKQMERGLAKMLTDTNMGQVVNRTNKGTRKK